MLSGNLGVKCSEKTHPDKSGSDDDFPKLALRALIRLSKIYKFFFSNKTFFNLKGKTNKLSMQLQYY